MPPQTPLDYPDIAMDEKEDLWWKLDAPSFRSTDDLPASSRWMFRRKDSAIIVKIDGQQTDYYVHQKWMPIFLLLDIVQYNYLWMAIFTKSVHHNQGVLFMDYLRQDFIQELMKNGGTANSPGEDWMPQQIHRWGCRFILGIPRDPVYRRKNEELLSSM